MLKVTVLAKIAIDRFEKKQKQLAFATSKTINKAAFDAREAVQANLPKWLKISRPFLPKSVVVNRSTKTKLYSEVYFLDRVKFSRLLEEGGTRKPFKARMLAIPRSVKTSDRPVPKSKRPSVLLNRKDTFRKTINGIDGIWQATKDRRIKLLYQFERTAQYEPRKIHFVKTVKSVAQNSIDKNFGKNLADAFRTAK